MIAPGSIQVVPVDAGTLVVDPVTGEEGTVTEQIFIKTTQNKLFVTHAVYAALKRQLGGTRH